MPSVLARGHKGQESYAGIQIVEQEGRADAQSQPSQGASAAERLITQEKVDFILGPAQGSLQLSTADPTAATMGHHVALVGHGLPETASAVVLFDEIPATVLASRPDLGRIFVVVPNGLSIGTHTVTVTI